ncbi:hypothetical protein SNEBB_007799 [Seison nebaliae]|nr:hypothetical protein SNEBB_007799 [Seison nebaliae]
MFSDQRRHVLSFILPVLLTFIWVVSFVGLRPDHIIGYTLAIFAYFAHSRSRKLLIDFSVYIVYWLIYDSMRVVPNYTVNIVHIKQPYMLEKTLFGIRVSHNVTLTPNEYFDRHYLPIFDLLCGICYLNWIPLPLLFSIYCYVKKRYLFFQFCFAFLFVNLLGFAIYYIYPAAPPWYVKQYGFRLIETTQGSRANLYRFDELLHIGVFNFIYEKNSNIFAAIPSLHSAYPVILLYFGRQLKNRSATIFFTLFMFGIWFSAVYTGHHYLIDVIAGMLCALVSLAIYIPIISHQTVRERLNQCHPSLDLEKGLV